MRIADQIKSARIQKEYTQEQSAENLMVSRQTISNWENGKSLPDIVSIIRMSDLYDVSLDELLKGDKVLMEKIEKDAMAVKAEKNHKVCLDIYCIGCYCDYSWKYFRR
ncbi:helix-turn-helix transcriptional regulator [Massilimicrobiota timonensis]|uniref:helix-turn-helix transcriptional regulator n=1 Tax=Massilimicrobiota timonensis TaxID=1776392 RepID=UPI0019608805|nr:helix-turn-helix transcriptional regulator [Massilimicrobiota timonensis]MBM6966750.1 helix-turn-helix transcriptional regulator [Massilimicrobiota timonensis]